MLCNIVGVQIQDQVNFFNRSYKFSYVENIDAITIYKSV
jgi:hypothetical protein